MQKYICTILIFFFTASIYSQDNSKYFYEPFPVYKSDGQVVIAGNVNAFVYSNYYGKNVQSEGYTDPHVKPECLVYELFTEMKNKNLDAIGKLYDTSYDKKNFDGNRMADMMKNYTDIKFVSKFRSGDRVIVRYDFVSAGKKFPFFAALRNNGGKYFLTTQINVSEPFNVIGSFSPNNLFEKKEDKVNIKNMTPFYFVNKGNKVLFTNQTPPEDYSALYFSFEFYNQFSHSPEIDFLKALQKTAVSDSARLKIFIAPDQLSLLSSDYYGPYFYAEIKKIFRDYSIIIPLGSLKINDGKILYFKIGNPDETPLHVVSVILKKEGGRYYLGLRITDDNINNILWNVYIREAIYDFFDKRPL
ncbi:MAG TPA: hypothetical protein VET23_09775 [Chitinophagaceae bacterium]|nr:hypothetical protein [Chitinophagaceae bacterium]